MNSYNVYANLILVSKVLESENPLDKIGVFKNKVKILSFGEDIKDISVDDNILVREYSVYECPYTKECYIYKEAILRKL